MLSVAPREGAWRGHSHYSDSGRQEMMTDDSASVAPLPRAPLTTSVSLALRGRQNHNTCCCPFSQRCQEPRPEKRRELGHKGKKKGINGPFKHGAPCGPVCMTCHIQLTTGLTTETNQKGVGSPKQSDLFGAGRTKSGEGCAVWKVLLDSSKPRKGREMKTLIMAWGSRYVNMSSQVDFSIPLQKTIFRNDTHHLLSTYYIPGEAHVEGSEGCFQTTASKELKPSAQQPVRNWIQLTTT
uniref:Uncharacterized protein LOC109550124 isoform X2 n=1 Tax=Tursiops truncatus TaxID=9739 RepID=A0A2U4BED4_TURTR|nr:uncharacterized protein LOC109550124 isoform X2 [Tursiops truncatus]